MLREMGLALDLGTILFAEATAHGVIPAGSKARVLIFLTMRGADCTEGEDRGEHKKECPRKETANARINVFVIHAFSPPEYGFSPACVSTIS